MSNKCMRIIALVLVLVCMLVSCEKKEQIINIINDITLEYYKENLDIEYNINTMDQNLLAFFDESYKVDFCQHGATNGLIATHKYNGNQILILEITFPL